MSEDFVSSDSSIKSQTASSPCCGDIKWRCSWIPMLCFICFIYSFMFICIQPESIVTWLRKIKMQLHQISRSGWFEKSGGAAGSDFLIGFVWESPIIRRDKIGIREKVLISNFSDFRCLSLVQDNLSMTRSLCKIHSDLHFLRKES